MIFIAILYKDDIALYTCNHGFSKFPEMYIAIKTNKTNLKISFLKKLKMES